MAAYLNGLPQSNEALSMENCRYLRVAADMTAAAWNTQATHEVFNVTGLCRLRLWIEGTGNIDSAAHGATVCFGNAAASNAYIVDTDETELDSGDLWYDATPTTGIDTFGTAVFDVVSNGIDIGYEIKVEALTTGSLAFHCVWEPLAAGASVVAGTGVAL